MITCPKCSKENQDHYKFCLGCGAELPRDVAPKAFSPQTPPHGIKPFQGGASGAAALPTAVAAPRPMASPGAAAPSAEGRVSAMRAVNAPSNKFARRAATT